MILQTTSVACKSGMLGLVSWPDSHGESGHETRLTALQLTPLLTVLSYHIMSHVVGSGHKSRDFTIATCATLSITITSIKTCRGASEVYTS